MRYFLVLLTVISLQASAQTAEDSVKIVVNQLFEGMKNADPVLAKGVFSDSAILQTIDERDGKVKVKTDKVDEFVNFLGQIKKGDADERIVFETVKVDGALAIVWTPYQFYYKGKFSHCGVNSFHLVRFDGKWKIYFLIDTRRKVNCP